MTLLITGGAGFIGGNFIREWLADACNGPIINLDALTYAGNLATLADIAEDKRYQLIQGDICDAALLEKIFAQHQPSAVMHFAAESHVDRSIHGPQEFIRTNIQGTFTLLETARHYIATQHESQRAAFRFIHISTDEVFGSLSTDASAFTETCPYAPNSPYAASKASADHLVRAWHHTYGLPTIITHCSNNYGPYQFPEKLIPLMIVNALAGKPLPIYGDGKHIRDWLYVSDHCAALRAILARGKPGETYAIGGNNEQTNATMAEAICDQLDHLAPPANQGLAIGSYRELITHVTDRPGHDRRYAINAQKIARDLGWQPKETFASGLEKTIRWYLAHPQWVADVQTGAYREWISHHYGKEAS